MFPPMAEQRNYCRFSSVLSSAFLEWLLMLLLFLDAILLFLLRKVACFSKLQAPCLMCSRLNILPKGKQGFYKDLICSTHKSEISSLAYCRIHLKLGNVQEMCKRCLLSFVTDKKSGPHTCKLMTGRLLQVDADDVENAHLNCHAAVDNDGLEDKSFDDDEMAEVPLLKKDLEPGFLCTRLCSCCSKPFTSKSHAHTLLRDQTNGADIVCQDGLDERRKRSSGQSAGDRGIDCLSHIGYSELKITSDSEPDVPVSDDDDGNGLVHGTADLEEEVAVRENLNIPSPVLAEASCSVPEEQLLGASCDVSSSLSITSDSEPDVPVSDDDDGNGLVHGTADLEEEVAVRENLNIPSPVLAEASCSVPEEQLLGASCDVSSSLSITAVGQGLEEIKWNQVKARAGFPLQSEIISEEVPEEIALKCPEIGDAGCIPTTPKPELIRTSGYSGKNLTAIRTINDTYRLSVGKGAMPSPTFAEKVKGRESARYHEDLKLKLSQLSTILPWNDLTPSPRLHGQGDESKISDACSFSVSAPKRRLESSLECLEGSVINEIEGESEVDRLKRQVELAKNSMIILYKELEEERSASAIAANQAMAMINRLQEEKAAMQMEALQYLRMLEEQAEYDQEALQKSNDLLVEREKEIQDLEAEIECYRKQFGDEILSEDVLEPLCDSDVKIYGSASSASGMNSGSGDKAEQTLTSSKDIGGPNHLF